MDTSAIVISASCAAAAGFGAMMGGRLFPVLLARRRELANFQQVDHDLINQDADEGEMAAYTKLRARTSSVIGVYRDALRHTGGAFTRAYHVELSPAVFSDDLVIESRCDAFARMLAARKPIGTVIQFRLTAGVDPGRAIAAHESARDRANIHYDAALLHDGGIAGYRAMADLGCFRQTKLKVWVRVPNPYRHAEDQFLTTFKREIKARGFAELPLALASSWRAASGEQIARRLLDEEAAAFEEAEKTFRLIERECPVKLTPFTRDELWAAVFLGQRQNAASVPVLPDDGTDLRDYLCGETIEANGQYAMHGNCPAALISMFTPPQPSITADALRLLSVNGSLNFRHTIVSEFVYPDQRQAVKRLDRRISQVGRSAQSLTGKHRFSPEAQVALEDLARLRQDLAGGRAALAQMRFFVVVYGEPARTRAELAASLKNLDSYCEQMISEIRKIPGADADREEPAALRALYGRALVGEADARKTGREIVETAHSLAPLIPTESEWEGAPRPHTLFSLPTGKLIGVDLFDRQLIPSPLALALAAPRGGKSVLLGRLINDVLATKAHACVRAVDFGESFGPLVDVLGGRHLRFQPGTDRTINIWDYDGLENGEPPDEIQIGFVVGDLMQLARVAPDDTLAEDILITLVNEVYRNEAPRNRPGAPKHEPRLSHLVDYLGAWPFKGASASRAEELKLSLGQYCGHSFLDAPTHPDFAGESPLDVYELDSLERFPERVRESLAYRAAARVLRAIGKLKEDGTRSPTLLVFDEVWKIREKYPRILDVVKRGARTGGKENVVTILATQAYEDLSSLPDIAKTAGVKFIGKQIGDYSKLVEDTGLSLQAAAAISVIHNAPGSHAQFLLALGSGEDKVALGVLLAALLLPTPARAQWTVFDPANYKVQIKRQIEELSRWLDTVNQYTRMYENAVGQLTNLRGILRTADELMARDKRMRTFVSYWGQVIRLTFRVKNQLTNLITGNLRAIASMERRLRDGIFDPEANRRDFEEYLRYGIGRTAQDTESELERLKRMDNQFERLEHDHQIAADNAAQLQAYLAAKKEEIERLKHCDDCTEKDRDLERLSFEIAKLEEKATRAQAEAARLLDLKAKRAEAIYQVEMQRIHFGRTIRSMNRAWKGITTATRELRDNLEKAGNGN